jgi:hypothetical protein
MATENTESTERRLQFLGNKTVNENEKVRIQMNRTTRFWDIEIAIFKWGGEFKQSSSVVSVPSVAK